MYNYVAVDLAAHRQTVAHALDALETSIARLLDALLHRPVWLCVEGRSDERAALASVCAAYSSIDYGMDDEVGTSVVCLGVVGASTDVVRRAQAVNAAKASLKAVCAPLQRIRTRVPQGAGTKAIPVIRAVLRGIQRSDLNLLAAYRRIPILERAPATITYTRARTRAVYRKSVEDIHALLINLQGPTAAADRARLSGLGRQERYLAIARAHYDNVRANIVYSTLDRRGRGRVQIAAELPLLYTLGRHQPPPEVRFAAPADATTAAPRRVRQASLEPEPFLHSIPAYRYANAQRRRESRDARD